MTSIKGDQQLESIDIKNDDNEIKTIKTDYVLGFWFNNAIRSNCKLGS